MKTGFTLIELMIAITIIGVMVSLGVSAYGKARDRQIGQSAAEQIISIFQENQKNAIIGKNDCTGVFTGQKITTSSTGTLSSQSLCTINPGVADDTIINGLTSITPATIIFNPLSGGTTITTNPQNIDFTSDNGTIFRIQIQKSGTIEYLGIQ